MTNYYFNNGGLPSQAKILTNRAIFNEAYIVIPKSVQTDIVTSIFPNWENARAWILSRPLSGFSETFSQYLLELDINGGSDNPEPNEDAEAVLFVVKGSIIISIDNKEHIMDEGGYAYIPVTTKWQVRNNSNCKTQFHWIRKSYEYVDGIKIPEFFVTNEKDITPTPTDDKHDGWLTTRFVNTDDIRHDMHVNIVTFKPGSVIPFAETHVMEHGLYVLEGKAIYHLNQDWVEVEAGDYLWLRAYCPQGCYASGPDLFRYLLYKDVNRHPKLKLSHL